MKPLHFGIVFLVQAASVAESFAQSQPMVVSETARVVMELCRGGTTSGDGWQLELDVAGNSRSLVFDRLFEGELKTNARLTTEQWNGMRPLIGNHRDYVECVAQFKTLVQQHVEKAEYVCEEDLYVANRKKFTLHSFNFRDLNGLWHLAGGTMDRLHLDDYIQFEVESEIQADYERAVTLEDGFGQRVERGKARLDREEIHNKFSTITFSGSRSGSRIQEKFLVARSDRGDFLNLIPIQSGPREDNVFSRCRGIPRALPAREVIENLNAIKPLLGRVGIDEIDLLNNCVLDGEITRATLGRVKGGGRTLAERSLLSEDDAYAIAQWGYDELWDPLARSSPRELHRANEVFWRMIVELNHLDAYFHSVLGAVYDTGGKYPLARAAFKEAIRLDPADSNAARKNLQRLDELDL